MIKAGTQGLLRRQVHLLSGISRLLGSTRAFSQSRTQMRKEITIEQQNFPDFIFNNEAYVNKIPHILPLIRRQSGGFAVTAPRRMGKSITLSTLHSIKLLGIQDLCILLDMKGYEEVSRDLREFLESLSTDNLKYFQEPRPVLLIQAGGATNISQWQRKLKVGLERSLNDLLQYEERLDGKGKFKEQRDYMISQYRKILNTNVQDLTLFQNPGGLLLIDEYDSVFTKMSNTLEQREFSFKVISKLITDFKGANRCKCIVAGVYHPNANNFTESTHNYLVHYNEQINANAIAFTKKEVTDYFLFDIQTAIDKLPVKDREKLIRVIKSYLKFPPSQAVVINKQMDTYEEEIKSAKIKPMDEEYNEKKLAEYVIEIMFFMHDGFNLQIKSITSSSDTIISPLVVLNIIDRLRRNRSSFFSWEDYLKVAKRNHTKGLFTIQNYVALKPEAKKVLREVVGTGKVQVIGDTLYPERISIFELEPQYVLFQQGLLSVTEVEEINQNQHITLSVPNHGVRQYLLKMHKEISQIQKNFTQGFLDPQTKYEDRKKMVQGFFKETKDEVRAYTLSKLEPDQELDERYFTFYLAEYLQKLLQGTSIKIKIGNQRPHTKPKAGQSETTQAKIDQSNKEQKKTEKLKTKKTDREQTVTQTSEQQGSPSKKRGPKNAPLLPDLTISGEGYMKKTLIEIYRNKDKKRHEEKVKKYDELSGGKIGWIVVMGYDSEFKNIIQFEINSPGSYYQMKKDKDQKERKQKEKNERKKKEKEENLKKKKEGEKQKKKAEKKKQS